MKKIILPVCLFLLAGCYYDKEDQLYPDPGSGGGTGGGCDTTGMTYAADIAPIFNASCAVAGACHNGTARSSGYDLSNYSGSVNAANSGRLMGVIKHEPGFSPMPKGMQKLGDCEINKITAWINAGTPQ